MRAAAELGERHAAHPRHDDRGEVVPGIAVGPVRARLEVQRLLPRHDVEDVGVACRRARSAASQRCPPPRPSRAGPLVWVEQVADGERLAVVGQLGHVLPRGSSSDSLPSRASSSTAAAVNCLAIEPASMIVSAAFGAGARGRPCRRPSRAPPCRPLPRRRRIPVSSAVHFAKTASTFAESGVAGGRSKADKAATSASDAVRAIAGAFHSSAPPRGFRLRPFGLRRDFESPAPHQIRCRCQLTAASSIAG